MLRAVGGAPPSASQEGLKDTLRAQGYFLACICIPAADLEVALPGSDAVCRTRAQLACKEPLNRAILRIRLRCCKPFFHYSGQYLHLHRPDGLLRTYSISSLPSDGDTLELHVRHLSGGQMSSRIRDGLQVGDVVEVSGPHANCFYVPGKPDQGILLIGTRSGLAPLWGILRDALSHGHQGQIALFHGFGNRPDSIWSTNFAPLPRSILTSRTRRAWMPATLLELRSDALISSHYHRTPNWQVGASTSAGILTWRSRRRKKPFLAGASISNIYAEPFVRSKSLFTWQLVF